MAGNRQDGLDSGIYVTPQIRTFSPAELLELIGPTAVTTARPPVPVDGPVVFPRRTSVPRRGDH